MRSIISIIVIIILIAGATAWTYKLHGSPVVGIDDANIFFSYAENMAAGNGIRYAQNTERVEGFTSLLWMLMCSVMFWLGCNEAGVFGLCFVCLVLSQLLFLKALHVYLSEISRHVWVYSGVFVALILFSASYVTWMTITLMDTCLWGLIIAGMTYFLISPPRSGKAVFVAAVPYVLAPLTRPEALLVCPAFLVLLWLRSRSRGCGSATRRCLFLGISFLSMSILLTVFRLHYFGYPFPNTYYAKVSPSIFYNLMQGAEYLLRFTLSGTINGLMILVLLLLCAFLFGHIVDQVRSNRAFKLTRDFRLSAHAAVSLAGLVLLLVPVLTGGDHFNMFRFYQPAYPVFCLAPLLFAAKLLHDYDIEIHPDPRWWRGNLFKSVLVGMVLVLCASMFRTDSWFVLMDRRSLIQHEFGIAEEGMKTGRDLTSLFSGARRMPSIGVVIAGGIARTYKGPVIDLMGLNNELIAHHKGDRRGFKNHAAFEIEAFFLVRPDIILFSPNSFGSSVLKSLDRDPRFVAEWRYGTISSHVAGKSVVTGFIRNDLIARLKEERNLKYRDTMVWSSGNWAEVSACRKQEN